VWNSSNMYRSPGGGGGGGGGYRNGKKMTARVRSQ